MYFRMDNQFLTFPNGDSANAELLSDLSYIRGVDFWSAKEIAFRESEIIFSVFSHIELFDNYPTNETGVCLFSRRMIDVLQKHKVHMQILPAVLLDRDNQRIIAHDYVVCNLLELYPAIDLNASQSTSLKLTADFLRHPRPCFRPAESRPLILVAADLKHAIEQQTVTGCLFEHIEQLSVAVSLRRPARIRPNAL